MTPPRTAEREVVSPPGNTSPFHQEPLPDLLFGLASALLPEKYVWLTLGHSRTSDPLFVTYTTPIPLASSPCLENVPLWEEGKLKLSPNGPRQIIRVEWFSSTGLRFNPPMLSWNFRNWL